MTTNVNEFEEPFLADEQIQSDSIISPQTSSKLSSPLDSLKISSTKVLEKITERTPCPKCDKPVKYFCYWCYIIVGCDSSELPRVKLPIKIDVIKHHKEKVGKSTVAHAKIIAPDDVEIISYSQMPKIENPGRMLLLFPGPNSKTLQEIPRSSFDKLLVVDGTWRQASNMARTNPELKNIPTIEALYYFLKEYNEVYEIPEEAIHSDVSGYDGRYDNLL
ncbi:3205_t:CDS:2, partial [Racocetra persica]